MWADKFLNQILQHGFLRLFQMNQEIEERYVIKFLFKESCSGEEIHKRLTTVYRAPCYAQRTVFSWMQRVKLGQTILVDAPRYAHSSLECERTIGH
jgi:hypothetical protein